MLNAMARQLPVSVAPLLRFGRTHATLIALVVMVVALALMDSAFFTPRNLSNVSRQVTIIGIIAVGMTMVILVQGIDLSVGSIVGLSAVVVALLMQAGLGVWLAVAAAIATCGVFLGLWNGFWIAHYRIPPFIITLGMMTVARGLALSLSDGSSVPVTDPTFPSLGGAHVPPGVSVAVLAATAVAVTLAGIRRWQRTRREPSTGSSLEAAGGPLAWIVGLGLGVWVFGLYRGVPVPVAIYGVVALTAAFTLSHTRFGRRVYAVGGNEQAAHLSGVNVYWTKMTVYVLVAVLSSVSGILLCSRLNGASPNLGTMFELDAIAAVVIGGTSLQGGSGTIGGTVVGTLIIGVLNNGMSLLGVPTFHQLIIKGLIVILAVWFDVINKRRSVASAAGR